MSDSNSTTTQAEIDLDQTLADIQNEELDTGNEKQDALVAEDTDDLDAFSDLLTGKRKAQAAEEAEPSKKDQKEKPEQQSEGTDDALATEPEQKEPKPKSRFQERIDELTHKAREAERKEKELQAKLDEVLAKLDGTNKEPQNPPTQKSEGPQPDELDENGEAKYPLGEFDPAFIRDLTRFELRRELEIQAAKEAEAREQAKTQEAQRALQQEWQQRVDKALEKYPDLPEKEETLATAFEGTDEKYGAYLASVIMSMDYGPDVLYYLSNNLAEAKRIVDSGPARATIALGRLEARFALQEEEKSAEAKKLKVSKAPEPPERLNKGNMVTKEIPDDTDDLDAFAAKLFNTRGRR
jgi:hypothetical protein